MIDKALLLSLTLANGADFASTEHLRLHCDSFTRANAPTRTCTFREYNVFAGNSVYQRFIFKGGISFLQYKALKGKSKRTKIIFGGLIIAGNAYIVKRHMDKARELK